MIVITIIVITVMTIDYCLFKNVSSLNHYSIILGRWYHLRVITKRILYSTEAVFTILADTFGADQETAYSDYMELALQLQYALRTPVSV